MLDIAGNIAHVRTRMAEAQARACRPENSVKLVLAAKYQPIEALVAAIAAGETFFGHNKIQQLVDAEEGLAKAGYSSATHTTSVIGHVQSNKLSHAMHYAQRIDTVDTFKTAQQIDRRQRIRIDSGEVEPNTPYPILVQVNSSGAPTQFGCNPGELLALAAHISETLELVQIRGLMTIGAHTPDDPHAVVRSFDVTRTLSEKMRELNGLAQANTLSMGMTHDLELAIEHGSTEIRIGTAIFGPRPFK